MSERPPPAAAWAVILAGGIGSRFWPASTAERPKQLLPFSEGRPLVASAWERACAVAGPERVRLLAPERLAEGLLAALPEADASHLWIEPEAKGTAPALASAAWEIERREPGAAMIALHADHFASPLSEFERTASAALALARAEEALVCVAVPPTRPETGYGYIEPGEAVALGAAGASGSGAPRGSGAEPVGGGGAGTGATSGEPSAPRSASSGDPVPQGPASPRETTAARPAIRPSLSAFRVRAFREKPEPAAAEAYVSSGWLWNSGIFAWPAGVFLDEVRRLAPELGSLLALLERFDGGAAFFREAPSCVVDRAVLERSRRVAAVRATFEWDDVGGWEALARRARADERGNAVFGDALVVSGSDNVVFAEGGRVVVHGVDGAVVVRSGRETLVLARERAGDLKRLLERLGEPS